MTTRIPNAEEIAVAEMRLAEALLNKNKDKAGKSVLDPKQKQDIDKACADKVKPKGGKA